MQRRGLDHRAGLEVYAERLLLFRLPGVPDEDLRDVQGCDMGAAPCQQSGVVAFPAADVESRGPLHVGEHLEERGRVQVVAIDVHCAAPVCNPSRVAVMLGRLPSAGRLERPFLVLAYAYLLLLLIGPACRGTMP